VGLRADPIRGVRDRVKAEKRAYSLTLGAESPGKQAQRPLGFNCLRDV